MNQQEKEEKNQEVNEQNSQQAPSATLLNSIVLSVRLADDSIRHIQLSVFELDQTHKVSVYYDVIDPSKVNFKK